MIKFTKVRLIGLAQYDLPIIGAKLDDPYICKAIDGLGPSEVDVHVSNLAQQGGFFQGRRPNNREIVIRIGLNPNYILGESPAALRQALYGLLTTDASRGDIDIQLLDGNTVVAVTSGWVKKFETVLFSKEPEVQITFTTVEPYLSAPAELTLSPIDDTNFVINNLGSAPAGIKMNITLSAAMDYIQFTHDGYEFSVGKIEDTANPGEYMWPGFLAGDVVDINTILGQRAVSYTRSSVVTNAIDLVEGKWLELHGGLNTIVVFPTANLVINNVKYTPKYWGV